MTESEHILEMDYNTNNRWFGLNNNDQYSSSQSLFKYGSGVYGTEGLSGASSQTDFAGMRSPPPPSTSISVMSAFKETQSEMDVSYACHKHWPVAWSEWA